MISADAQPPGTTLAGRGGSGRLRCGARSLPARPSGRRASGHAGGPPVAALQARGTMGESERRAIPLSVVQLLAGALAAVSAAVVASTFGLAGTLLGAAVTSVVATVAGALYSHSLERARARVRIRRDPATGALAREVLPPPSAPRPIRWGLVAGAAVLVFALALGVITALELAARRPVASLVGHAPRAPAGTTLGTLVQELAPPAPAEVTPGTPAATTPTVAVPAVPPASTATAAVPAPTATLQAPTPLPAAAPTPHAPAVPTSAPVAPATAPAGPPGP